MKSRTTLNEKALIKKILARRHAEPREPGIPARKVRGFLAAIGKEIETTGSLSKKHVDELFVKITSGIK